MENKENLRIDLGGEDELSGPSRAYRTTPRNSVLGQASPTAKATPYTNLRHLAGIIRRPSTPRNRASSVGARSSLIQADSTTPNIHPRTAPSARRPMRPSSANRSNPTTPHAIRALQQRRATPGRDRRKSGRMQRETPRDALRNLSKILATTTQPTEPSPASSQPLSKPSSEIEAESFEDELDTPKASFSIAIDDDTENDDSFHMAPPRLSMPLEDGEQTAKSVEMPRRVDLGERQGRLSRGSFGSIRASDRFDVADESEMHDFSLAGRVEKTHGFPHDGDEDAIGESMTDLGDNAIGTQNPFLVDVDPLENRSRDGYKRQYQHAGTFSPFVLDIPEIKPLSSSPQPPANLDELFDDDVLQSDIHVPKITPKGPTKGLANRKHLKRSSKPLKVSRHGIPYPGLPSGVIKKVASTFARSTDGRRSRLNKDTLSAIIEASDNFFEQFSGDLEAFASHKGSKKIDETDVITAMKRQRQVSVTATPFSLAHRYLPEELLHDMRVPLPKTTRNCQKRPLEVIYDVDEEDDL